MRALPSDQGPPAERGQRRRSTARSRSIAEAGSPTCGTGGPKRTDAATANGTGRSPTSSRSCGRLPSSPGASQARPHLRALQPRDESRRSSPGCSANWRPACRGRLPSLSCSSLCRYMRSVGPFCRRLGRHASGIDRLAACCAIMFDRSLNGFLHPMHSTGSAIVGRVISRRAS